MAKKKFKPIPAVPFDALVKGHESVNVDRERYGSADPTVSIVRVLHKDHEPEEIMAVSYRLGALAKLIQEGEGKPWTFAVTDENYHMVNEALFRAAARAPLFEARTVGEVSFDLDTFRRSRLRRPRQKAVPDQRLHRVIRAAAFRAAPRLHDKRIARARLNV
jgi:hypothetical protein